MPKASENRVEEAWAYLGGMAPMAEWPQIMEGNIVHIIIVVNILLDVMLMIYNVVLFYWSLGDL